MPLIPFFLALLIFFALILAIPFGLVQRYRLGKARHVGRRWLATLNLVAITLSAVMLIWASALTSFWVPNAFWYVVFGLSGGIVLGLLGLAWSRWEHTPSTLYYTPNQWLVLVITFAVVARLFYVFWRAWHAWQTVDWGESWHTSTGVAGSLAVGALVVGYYLSYSAGVYRRIRRHSRDYSPAG